jgi:tRNA dimethylallyltransferase
MRDVICLMGPTASGKTAFACDLLRYFPCEIISVDSAMIYRGMDIGTAKPDARTLKQAPHYLIDIRDPHETYSVAAFCEDARVLCDEVLKRGKIPLLVGGSMMYFRAFQQGLSALPERNAKVREALLLDAATHGPDYLYQELQAVDPVTAARLHPHDAQRIQRALEVYRVTGCALSDAHVGVPPTLSVHASDYHFINVILFPERRAWLHARIAERFEQMLAAGFLDEVQTLCEHWNVEASCPAMRSVGYRQALDYLEGVCDYDAFHARGVAATRQLAKRQLTWLRSWPDAHRFDPETPACFERMLELLKREI